MEGLCVDCQQPCCREDFLYKRDVSENYEVHLPSNVRKVGDQWRLITAIFPHPVRCQCTLNDGERMQGQEETKRTALIGSMSTCEEVLQPQLSPVMLTERI